jgi:hypothetical protein
MEKYIQMFKENPLSFLKEVYLLKVQPELYKNIIQFAIDNNLNVKFSQKVYHYLYQLTELPKCKTCEMEIPTFNTATTGYNKFCSTKCSKLSKETTSKYKETLLSKYGTTDLLNSKESQDKIKENNLRKLGVEHHTKSSSWQDSQKEKNLELYGIEHHFQSEDVKSKIKSTNLEKIGVDHHSKTEEFKSNMKLNTPEVQESAKETLLRKYGYDNPRTTRLLLDNLLKAKLELHDYDIDTDTYDLKCQKGHSFKMTRFEYEERVKNNTLHICPTCKKY